jgi:hypothetical protein
MAARTEPAQRKKERMFSIEMGEKHGETKGGVIQRTPGAHRAASGARERENLDRRNDWKGIPGPTTGVRHRSLATEEASVPERRELSGGGL